MEGGGREGSLETERSTEAGRGNPGSSQQRSLTAWAVEREPRESGREGKPSQQQLGEGAAIPCPQNTD